MKFSRVVFIVLIVVVFADCKNEVVKQARYEYTNDLIEETSPYLLQHAHNPVDWKAWDDTVFEQAEKENKLVLISIGYSSCHWCHVMEEETFTNKEIAKIMNSNFINIKVDREERPDVDKVYMSALQLMTGSGGWPLNVIVLPNGKPLYGGTYHAPEEWKSVLTKVNSFYKKDSIKANEYADMVAEGIAEVSIMVPMRSDESLSSEKVTESVQFWKQDWDTVYGGEQTEQKFMKPTNLAFLLDYSVVYKDDQVINHVKNTLNQIANSGSYDQIGGGFFRYSTTKDWAIPHFEKMLYDNAQAISLYAKAYSYFKNPRYKQIALGTINFLEENMKNDTGGFFAAMNADSEGEEGKHYVWSIDALRKIAGNNYTLFSEYYGIETKNTLEENQYILQRLVVSSDFLKKYNLTVEAFNSIKTSWEKELLKERDQRVLPSIDDKILTSWNALLINGYVEAYKAFGDEKFLIEATQIFDFIKERSFNNTSLQHSYKKGGRKTVGFLEDYATVTNASIMLYTVTLNQDYLDFAKKLHTITIQKFKDDQSDFYRYNESNSLLTHIIPLQDGIMDSPNALMAENFFLLSHMDYDMELLAEAKKMVSAMTTFIQEHPESYAKWNLLAMQMSNTYYELAVVGPNTKDFIKQINREFLPNTFVVGTNTESDLKIFENRFMDSKTMIYVCLNKSCKLPVNAVSKALKQMEYVSKKKGTIQPTSP